MSFCPVRSLTIALFSLQEEAIPESLKNILLVMADGGYLVPPSQDPSKEEMWLETRKRLGRFLPDLFAEIFPESAKEPEKSQPGSAVPSPPKVSSGDGETDEKEDAALPPTGESTETEAVATGEGDIVEEPSAAAETEPAPQDDFS